MQTQTGESVHFTVTTCIRAAVDAAANAVKKHGRLLSLAKYVVPADEDKVGLCADGRTNLWYGNLVLTFQDGMQLLLHGVTFGCLCEVSSILDKVCGEINLSILQNIPYTSLFIGGLKNKETIDLRAEVCKNLEGSDV